MIKPGGGVKEVARLLDNKNHHESTAMQSRLFLECSKEWTVQKLQRWLYRHWTLERLDFKNPMVVASNLCRDMQKVFYLLTVRVIMNFCLDFVS